MAPVRRFELLFIVDAFVPRREGSRAEPMDKTTRPLHAAARLKRGKYVLLRVPVVLKRHAIY